MSVLTTRLGAVEILCDPTEPMGLLLNVEQPDEALTPQELYHAAAMGVVLYDDMTYMEALAAVRLCLYGDE
jgi:hypothetical protein